MYKIDKGVSVPAKGHNGGRPPVYPFRQMEVGDSFFVGNKKYSTVRRSATVFGQRLGRKFTTRKMDGGVRVWRIK